jgi:hypothetical protein
MIARIATGKKGGAGTDEEARHRNGARKNRAAGGREKVE